MRWGLQDWSWRAGLQRVGPVWLEEQFSQRLGPGPDLSVAGVEGERLVWIKAREGGREEGGGWAWEGERMERQAALQSVHSVGRGLTGGGMGRLSSPSTFALLCNLPELF